MVKSTLFLGLVAAFIGWNTQAQPLSKEVVVNVADFFVPGGFDSNSDVFVVASGTFPNGCYSWKEAMVEHKAENIHEVRVIADVQQGMCIQVLIPFTKDVQLGRFESGEHALRFMNGDGTFIEKRMVIE